MPLEDLQSSLTFSFHHCVTKDLERTQQHTKPEKLQPDTAAESALFIIILQKDGKEIHPEAIALGNVLLASSCTNTSTYRGW